MLTVVTGIFKAGRAFLTVVCMLSALDGYGTSDVDFGSWYKQCLEYTLENKSELACAYADSLLVVTASDFLSYDRLAALACAAQAYLSADEYVKAHELIEEGLRLWDRCGSVDGFVDERNPAPVPILFNSAGVCAVSYEINYEKAVSCFIRGLEFSRARNLDPPCLPLTYNLIMTCNVREDASGLRYAEEIYERGVAVSDIRLRDMGACGLALMYYHARDFDQALSYVRKIADSGESSCNALVCCTHAMILEALGRTEDAGIRFGQALEQLDSEPSTSASYICLAYGRYLVRNGRYREALGILERGLHVAGEKGNKVFTYRLYETLSEAYSALGHYRQALESYRRYHQLSARVFDIRKEQSIDELMVKYRTALHEAEIRRKDLKILEKSHALELSIVVIVVMFVALGVVGGLYRYKNRLYVRIARQYQDAVRREKRMEELVVQGGARIDSDRTAEIVSKLEDLMLGQKIYRDSTLSRDKLAELIGTNRTYLSKVVNDRFGKSVSQLINTYRVNRAVELLGNTDAGLSMKRIEEESGFSSSSSFFRIFKDHVGMSPAKFREKTLEIVHESAPRSES